VDSDVGQPLDYRFLFNSYPPPRGFLWRSPLPTVAKTSRCSFFYRGLFSFSPDWGCSMSVPSPVPPLSVELRSITFFSVPFRRFPLMGLIFVLNSCFLTKSSRFDRTPYIRWIIIYQKSGFCRFLDFLGFFKAQNVTF